MPNISAPTASVKTVAIIAAVKATVAVVVEEKKPKTKNLTIIIVLYIYPN